jgi:hypothetical protein
LSENKNSKTRGVSINKPSDVRRIARRVISDIFQENSQIEHAGKVNQLLQTWLKGWEAEKIEDLERRIKEIEADTKRWRGR